jgi:hypothetical protein
MADGDEKTTGLDKVLFVLLVIAGIIAFFYYRP